VVQTVAGLNRGLAVTAAGGLVSFDPVNIAASAIALNHPVGAAGLFEQDGDTFAVTANRDGTLSVLESDGGVFRESVSVAVAGLTDPSALQVVGAGDGFLEVYVTEAGNGTPLALLVPTALGGALLPPVPDPGGGPVTTPTPLAPGSAAFIVVLLSPSLIAPDKEPATGDRDSSSELAGPAAAPVADGRVPAEQAGVTDGVITGGGADVFVELTDALAAAEGSEGVPTERPAELQQFITGWHEALERLGWHGRRPDEPKPPAEPKPSEAPAPPPTAARDTLISPQSPRFTVTEPGLQAPHAHPGQSDSSAGLPGSGMAVVALVTGLLYPGAIRGWTASVRPPCRPTVPARRARRRHDPR
jgi:hypothetical protein